MNLSSFVDTVEILNMDEDLSNPSTDALILSSEPGLDQSHYVISDADDELLILIEFKQETSLSKDVNIYKLSNVDIDFDDLESLKPDKSVECSIHKLSKGQNITLQTESKLALKFKSIQYLAIFIKTNQNETQKTLINNILFIGDHFSSISDCESIQRIISGLIRYQNVNKLYETPKQKQLDSLPNEHEQSLAIEEFTDYLLTKYPNYMDDIIHLHQKHEYDLEKIHDLLLENDECQRCDINNCLVTDRHCDINDGKNGNIEVYNENNMDPLHVFHSQIWDSTHFYIAHLFELGIRERAGDKNEDIKGNEPEYDEKDEWNITDHEMNRRWHGILHKRNQIPRVYNARFNSDSKFIIKQVTESTSLPIIATSSNIDTEIDDMIQCLVEQNKINDEEIEEFIRFIRDQKYDTESIFMDVEVDNMTSSNIFRVFPTFQSVLNTHITHRKCMLII